MEDRVKVRKVRLKRRRGGQRQAVEGGRGQRMGVEGSTHARTHARTHSGRAFISFFTHTRAHTYTHIYTHIHTHARTRAFAHTHPPSALASCAFPVHPITHTHTCTMRPLSPTILGTLPTLLMRRTPLRTSGSDRSNTSDTNRLMSTCEGAAVRRAWEGKRREDASSRSLCW